MTSADPGTPEWLRGRAIRPDRSSITQFEPLVTLSDALAALEVRDAAILHELFNPDGAERPRQTYTITVLPSSGNDSKTVTAASLTEALDAVTRRNDGEPWSDGPNPWVLTFHIARGESVPFDHAGAVARMKDDLALQEYRADVAAMGADRVDHDRDQTDA